VFAICGVYARLDVSPARLARFPRTHEEGRSKLQRNARDRFPFLAVESKQLSAQSHTLDTRSISLSTLQLEYRSVWECIPLGEDGTECLDNLHQVIEHFEWAAGVCRRSTDATLAYQRMRVLFI
jgi:hypothetical protein